jgi:hypothetical protein
VPIVAGIRIIQTWRGCMQFWVKVVELWKLLDLAGKVGILDMQPHFLCFYSNHEAVMFLSWPNLPECRFGQNLPYLLFLLFFSFFFWISCPICSGLEVAIPTACLQTIKVQFRSQFLGCRCVIPLAQFVVYMCHGIWSICNMVPGKRIATGRSRSCVVIFSY